MAKDNVNFKGVEELLNNLERKLGEKKVKALAKKAINNAGGIVEKNLREDMKVFEDTGRSIEEVVRTNAAYKNYVTNSKIGWNGPHDRYRIIHLNEWGYNKKGRQIHPRGFGVIEKSIQRSSKIYLDEVRKELIKEL